MRIVAAALLLLFVTGTLSAAIECGCPSCLGADLSRCAKEQAPKKDCCKDEQPLSEPCACPHLEAQAQPALPTGHIVEHVSATPVDLVKHHVEIAPVRTSPPRRSTVSLQYRPPAVLCVFRI